MMVTTKKKTKKTIVKKPEPVDSDKDERARILEALSKNPAFDLPSKDFKSFSKFDPIEDDGIPASELLIRDRR